MRSQITSQATELAASKGVVRELASGSEALRLEMGQVKQNLALKDQSLVKAEETAAEMRRRLQQLNSTYLTSGGQRASNALRRAVLPGACACPACCC